MDAEQSKAQTRHSKFIDVGAIWKVLSKYKKLYCVVLLIAFIIGVLIAFSIPRTYSCKVLLAPETSNKNSNAGLASLASTLGVSMGGDLGVSSGVVSPEFYPDLMQSVDFKTALFSVKVKRKGDKQTMNYYDYLKNEWKYPWWSDWFGLRAPVKDKDTIVNPFELTGEQSRIADMINSNVDCSINNVTGLISINVTAQDPYIAALLADSVKTRLQEFLTDFRTSKARHDLEYALSLQAQAKKDYERMRQIYVDFMDANNEVILMSERRKQTDLENEMQLLYNNYTTLCAQVIADRAKVREVTPAFMTLQSATVPLGPSGPKRFQILLICLCLAVFGTTIWVLHKEDQLRRLVGLSSSKRP